MNQVREFMNYNEIDEVWGQLEQCPMQRHTRLDARDACSPALTKVADIEHWGSDSNPRTVLWYPFDKPVKTRGRVPADDVLGSQLSGSDEPVTVEPDLVADG
jgi:hypothetical protein